MFHTEPHEPVAEVRVPTAKLAKLSATTDSSGEDRVAPTKKKPKAPYKDLERRREQNRVNAQKSYYRKLNAIDALRTEVAELEERYKAQMQAIKSELPVPASSPAEATLSRSADQITPTAVNQRRQLQRLAAAHNALKDEHRMLQERHDVHVRFLQLVVDLERPRSVEEVSGTQSEARRASVLAELRACSPARMQHPLSVAECHLIGLDVYDEIQAFTESDAYMNTGWANQRWVEDGLLKLSVQKVFQDLTPHEIAARTWPVLTSPERLESFYSASMKMRCEVAQRVDENNVVLYEEYEANERDPVTGRETDVVVLVRSLVLVTLFPVNSGYVVLFYGIDPSRLHERDEAAAFVSVGVSERKLWLNKVSWWLWQDAGGHTTTTFVSSVSVEGECSSYWQPIELLLLALRWEHEVIGPTFALSSEDDAESVARQPTLADCLQEPCTTRACSPSKTAEAPTGSESWLRSP